MGGKILITTTQKALIDKWNEGKQEGLAEGKQEGLAEGRKEREALAREIERLRAELAKAGMAVE